MMPLDPTPVILKIEAIRSGGIPLTSKTPKHLVLRTKTEDGPLDVCISEDAAAELAAELGRHLQASGSR
jgi:hypothetical protein